jgi:hypothetical protein
MDLHLPIANLNAATIINCVLFGGFADDGNHTYCIFMFLLGSPECIGLLASGKLVLQWHS